MEKRSANITRPSGGPGKVLSLFGFFAITASMLMSADEYPAFAQSGLHAIFFLVVGGILWFLPVALCSAEMATIEGWENGGVFAWVGNTLGQRTGFVAIFFQWFQVTVGFMTMIYFVIGAFSYLLNFPELNTNPVYKVAAFLILYWVMTIAQLFGIGKTANLVKFCFIGGIIVPAAIQIFLAIHYVTTGGTLQMVTGAGALIPDFTKPATLAAFIPFVLAYTGIEASASHINEMKNAKRDYPLTLITLVVFAILLDGLGGLSVAAVVPVKELSLNSGIIQSLQTMFSQFTSNPGWLVKIIAGLMAFGMLGEISSWIIGPIRGLYTTAEMGVLPHYFNRLNRDGVPVRLVVMQGVVVSILGAAITLFAGSSNGSYALAMSLTVMAYLVVYILIFVAYLKIKLNKKTDSTLKRAFRIPGGRALGVAAAISGLTISLVTFVLTFLPVQGGNQGLTPLQHMAFLALGLLFVLTVPITIFSSAVKKGRIIEGATLTHTLRHFAASEVSTWTTLRGRGEHHLRQRKHKTERTPSP